MSSLSYSVETTRTKHIIRAIAAYENYERKKADEAAKAEAAKKAAEEAARKAASTTSSTSSSCKTPVVRHSPKSRRDLKASSKDNHSGSNNTTTTTQPMVFVVPTQPEPNVVGIRKSPRTSISPRRISRTTTDRNICAADDQGDKDMPAPTSHRRHHKHRKHAGTEKAVPSFREIPAKDEKFMSLRESKGHGSGHGVSISVIPPPRKTEVHHEHTHKHTEEGRASLAVSAAASANKGNDSDTGESSDEGESGTLETFLMTVLKKSSVHSSTVRGQVKLLFAEGIFTLPDLDDLLLDLNSQKWLRLSKTLDKRVVLACTTRSKVALSPRR